MKYTFTNMSGQEQTVDIPHTYIKQQCSALKISVLEACKLYLCDEGYLTDPTAESLTQKANPSRKRTKKIDPTKSALINHFYALLNDKEYWHNDTNQHIDNVVITTIGRQITFTIDDDTYELTLSKKRKPK